MTSLSSVLLSNLKLKILAPSYRHGPRPPVYASNHPSLLKRTIVKSLLNLPSIRDLYGKVTFANKFPYLWRFSSLKETKSSLVSIMYTGQKTFFHFTGPWDRYFADFGCPNIRIHLSKENKMLPKQILTLRPVGSPMQLVFTYWRPTFHAWLQTWPPRYVTFFGKTHTNNDLLSVRKLTDS